jgi:hypothetical protein
LCGVESGDVLLDVDGQRWRLPLAEIVAAHLVPEY